MPAAADDAATVVVLLIPEAEAVVGELRARHTPGGKRGMPPHVTLLGPFVEAGRLDAEVVRKLRGAIGDTLTFDLELSETARFDSGVLYLTVKPIEPVRVLIRKVCAAFPEFQPYGQFTPDEVIPHLTVATGEGFPDRATSNDAELFDRVEAALAGLMPIVCRARHVAVMAEDEQGWTVASEFELS